MLIFWLAASATSEFTYLDYCAACPWIGVIYGGLEYACPGYTFADVDFTYFTYYPRDLSPLPRGLAGVEKRAIGGRRSKRGTAVGRSALDAIMTYVFRCNPSSFKLTHVMQRSFRYNFSGNNLVGLHAAAILRHSCLHNKTSRARRIWSSYDIDSTIDPGCF